MLRNTYRALLDTLPHPALQVGTVLAIDEGVATIELPDGGIVRARGTASVGGQVFFRDEVIEGPAPTLPVELIEV